jgi:hypothetical protein
MANGISLEQILLLAEQLSLTDKVRLIERIAPQIERDIARSARDGKRTTLRGLWKGVDITEEDIESVRTEIWGGFPRESI